MFETAFSRSEFMLENASSSKTNDTARRDERASFGRSKHMLAAAAAFRHRYHELSHLCIEVVKVSLISEIL